MYLILFAIFNMKSGGLYILLIYFTYHYSTHAIMLWYLPENLWVEKRRKKTLVY